MGQKKIIKREFAIRGITLPSPFDHSSVLFLALANQGQLEIKFAGGRQAEPAVASYPGSASQAKIHE